MVNVEGSRLLDCNRVLTGYRILKICEFWSKVDDGTELKWYMWKDVAHLFGGCFG